MRTPLEQSVLKTIRDMRMMSPGDRVGVAVSGGADSVALLRLLIGLRTELGITLVVVHFNHGLRGEDSDGDARFVEELAREHQLVLASARGDVAGEAKRKKWNLEEAGRRLRYAFFQQVIAEGRATRIAIAHTADDQAETVLAHMFRGTGLTGLAGIHPVAGPIVRPLIGIRRVDLRHYLKELGQAWREDSTNQDLRRLRARIRIQLLPILERDFSSHVVAHLAGLAQLAREEEMLWATLVEDRLRACAGSRGEGFEIQSGDLLVPFRTSGSQSVARLAAQAENPIHWRALTERIIRRLYENLRGDRRNLSAANVEQVIRLAGESTSGRRVELPGGMVVERSFETLFFLPPRVEAMQCDAGETKAKLGSYQYVVSLPERGTVAISVPEIGRRFRLKVIDWPLRASETTRDYTVLDADLLRAPLILRNWRPGDAYRPRGRKQPQKLKRMFVKERIPSRERALWPVLESGGCAVWARGMQPADEVCASKRSRVGVLIEEDQL
jgi:tRNA(Ile)-lysidine synthase